MKTKNLTFISPLREKASHKINKDARGSLPFWEQSNPLNPSGQSHLKHFTPSSEQLPLFLHGCLSQGRTVKEFQPLINEHFYFSVYIYIYIYSLLYEQVESTNAVPLNIALPVMKCLTKTVYVYVHAVTLTRETNNYHTRTSFYILMLQWMTDFSLIKRMYQLSWSF